MAARRDPLRIVVVGQTPPPLGGQAIAIESFITGRYAGLKIFHVRMSFSKEPAEIGRVKIVKLLRLLGLIGRILWRRARTGAAVLYYPPAGPDLVPVIRDLVVLLSTRWAFNATVLHFHAGGVSDIEPRLPRPLRRAFRAAYGNAALAIETSAQNPPDGRRLRAKRIVVVPNGVREHPLATHGPPGKLEHEAPVLLYVGMLRESKGLLVLVQACERLRQRGWDFRVHLMGEFASARFREQLHEAITSAGLANQFIFLGSLSGDAKAVRFQESDIFCYPTYFESESFGIVVVEAMQFALPVVASRWRGVPAVVADGETGILVPPQDPASTAAALERLLADPALRHQMGKRGRELYLERFTEERYRRDMEAALSEL